MRMHYHCKGYSFKCFLRSCSRKRQKLGGDGDGTKREIEATNNGNWVYRVME